MLHLGQLFISQMFQRLDIKNIKNYLICFELKILEKKNMTEVKAPGYLG